YKQTQWIMGLTCAASGLGASVRRGAKWDIYPSLYCHDETNDPRGSACCPLPSSVSWPPVNLLHVYFLLLLAGVAPAGDFPPGQRGQGANEPQRRKRVMDPRLKQGSLERSLSKHWQQPDDKSQQSPRMPRLSLHVPSPVGFTPARSPEAKQTAVLASDGFFHNNIRKLARELSSLRKQPS
ncbi:hypothetical protein KUCAC02_004964, partial [Chaenocephalus aceratus]